MLWSTVRRRLHDDVIIGAVANCPHQFSYLLDKSIFLHSIHILRLPPLLCDRDLTSVLFNLVNRTFAVIGFTNERLPDGRTNASSSDTLLLQASQFLRAKLELRQLRGRMDGDEMQKRADWEASASEYGQ
jgi:hypothetical protein